MSVPIINKQASARVVTRAWQRIAQVPANLDRRDDFQPCYVCGRPVDTKSKGTRWLHVINGGWEAAEPGDVIDPAGDMDWLPVGSECFKAQPDLKRARSRLSACVAVDRKSDDFFGVVISGGVEVHRTEATRTATLADHRAFAWAESNGYLVEVD